MCMKYFIFHIWILIAHIIFWHEEPIYQCKTDNGILTKSEAKSGKEFWPKQCPTFFVDEYEWK